MQGAPTTCSISENRAEVQLAAVDSPNSWRQKSSRFRDGTKPIRVRPTQVLAIDAKKLKDLLEMNSLAGNSEACPHGLHAPLGRWNASGKADIAGGERVPSV